MSRNIQRHRRLFINVRDFKDAFVGHPHLVREIDSHTVQGAPCIIVHSYRALIRTVGFFKYNSAHHVFLRGQTQCHGKMLPSLHRRGTPPPDSNVDAFLCAWRLALGVDARPEEQLSSEPLLQHYGIDTRWLDVVDSVPHALFFATHCLVDSPHGGGMFTYVPNRNRFGFIYVFAVGDLQTVSLDGKNIVGYQTGSEGLLIADLRKLKPSLALRPHAQHGLLVRDTTGCLDLWNRVVARIAVPSQVSRRWISSPAFEPSELFPDKKWDGVFGHLTSPKMDRFLAAECAAGRQWGQIHRYDFHV
jgi:hypothetical protein